MLWFDFRVFLGRVECLSAVDAMRLKRGVRWLTIHYLEIILST